MELGVNNEGPPPLSAVFVYLSPSLFQLFPWRTSLFAISPILSYRRNRTHVHVHIHTLLLSSRRFIPSRKPDHAPWILFASSLVLRSYSRSKLRLPTALEVSGKSGRELYLSLAQHRERESKEEHVSRFPAGARYSDCLTPRYRSETKRTQTDTGISLHLSLYLMIYLPIARVARCDKLSTIRRNTALKL